MERSNSVGKRVFRAGRFRWFAVLAITGWLFSVPLAFGATMTYGFSVPAGLTDWSTNLAIQKFNPFFGTLQSVTLNYTGRLASELSVTNSSGGPASGLFAEQLTFDVGQGAITNVLDFKIGNLGSGQVTNTGMASVSQSASQTYATSLGAYIGTGVWLLPVSTATLDTLWISGGGYHSSEVTSASLAGTVTYNFTSGFAPVPEPDVNALLLTGSVVLLRGWFRSRRAL